ncbi:hypothetical protein ACIPXV_33845 [Streptomyces libani]|uniref:hypothetical protein n=1 Tax=Streptomyces nigrescens TaxID=1920 RepID=UPI0037F7D181
MGPWPLRHERAGDLELYRARIGERLGRKKPTDTKAFFRFHTYRGVGARGLLDVAAEHGRQLDPDKKLRQLRRVGLTRKARQDTT